jgi:putative SOS response-associated peptidase YedK
MCGRYAITSPPEAIRAFFRYEEQPNFPPRYNIAPTQPVPIVIRARDASGEKKRRFLLVRWGLLPSFVKDSRDFPLLFNARSETAADKPSFRAAMKRRRCLFIADAFYEWRRDAGGSKTRTGRPYLFRRADGAPLALAGLFETWSGTDGSEIDTACILTTMANGTMAAIHDRMPAILEPSSFGPWLDCQETDAAAASRLLRPAGEDVLDFFEIGPAVNRVGNGSPEIQEAMRPGNGAGRVKPATSPSDRLF